MQHRHGFTLIELSIVLVIIGLLIGGVLAGRELIENAKIRAQVNQIEQIKTALNTFRIKYNAVPGDFHARAAAAGLKPGSGGGSDSIPDNGKLEGFVSTGSDLYNHQQYNEPTYFMGHLFDAGLYNGPRLCTETTPGYLNSPTRAYWSTRINPAGAFIANKYYDETWMIFGINRANVTTCVLNALPGVAGPIITPHQAYSIDAKLDDGYPDAGDIITARSTFAIFEDNSSTGCITAGADPLYNVTNTSIACMLRVFMLR